MLKDVAEKMNNQQSFDSEKKYGESNKKKVAS